MRRTNNKRRLYEFIMKDVSKIIKKHINESYINNEENLYIEWASSDTIKQVLKENPDYKVYIRKGMMIKGAKEHEVIKNELFNDIMEDFYDWGFAFSILINHSEKEIHIDGFTRYDLY